MQYSAHGSYSIKKEGNILLVDAQGPFNEITSQQYYQDIKDHTEKMSSAPWASLVFFKGNGVFTPDAEQGLIDTTHYRVNNGMIVIAAVINNTPHADILQMQLQRIYQNCEIPFNFFSDSTHAKLWLNNFINTHNKNIK
ncbi:MAG: hypothetical protein JJV99_04915 [Colwellia sp.]|nr:hypothetical protein [Colwellia sp.]